MAPHSLRELEETRPSYPRALLLARQWGQGQVRASSLLTPGLACLCVLLVQWASHKGNYDGPSDSLGFKIFLLKDYLFIFRWGGREREREGEKHQCAVGPCAPHTGDLTSNPGMCPDWESNRQPLGWQASAQPTEPHQPGQFGILMTGCRYLIQKFVRSTVRMGEGPRSGEN